MNIDSRPVGTVVKVSDMIEGGWYFHDSGSGRFVAGPTTTEEYRYVYLDGDSDMQSMMGLKQDATVTVAIPK